MTHWLELLDEAGGELNRRAGHMKVNYEELYKSILYIQKKEAELMEWVQHDWTPEEIQKAKDESDCQLPELQVDLSKLVL